MTDRLCPFCKSPLNLDATKCLCGATYRADDGKGCLGGGCMTLITAVLIVGFWMFVLFYLGSKGGTLLQ